MPDTFTLTIELGNDAMRDCEDIACALDSLAAHLHHFNAMSGVVRDANGNTVGRWEVV